MRTVNNKEIITGKLTLFGRLALWRHSIRGRLTVLNLILLGSFFIVLIFLQYFFLSTYLENEMDKSLRALAKPTIERFLSTQDGRDGQLSRVGPRIAYDLLSQDKVAIVLDEAGDLLRPSPAPPARPATTPTPGATGTPIATPTVVPTTVAGSTVITDSAGNVLFSSATTAENIFKQLGKPPESLIQAALRGETELSYETTLNGWGKADIVLVPLRQNIATAQSTNRYEAGNSVIGVLVLAGSAEQNEKTLSSVLYINLIAFVILLVIISLVSPLVARGSLTPLRRMIKTTNEIARGDLSRRVQLNTGEDEVGQLSQSFNQMVEKLENLFQSQRQLVADASHELRTPLTAIKGSLEVLLMSGVENNPAAANALVKTMHQETIRLSRLVNDLLTLNKLDQGEANLQLKPVRLEPFLREVKSNAEMLVQQSGKEISLDFSPVKNPDATVLASPDHLKQVLYNLLDNALKTSPSGSTISLEIVPPTTNREQYCLIVRDRGEGIPAEDLPRIFDRFYRGDVSRSRHKGGGSGLGLTIAQAIIKAHHGRIEVESTPGKGSAFKVYLLPVQSLALTEQGEGMAAGKDTRSTPKV